MDALTSAAHSTTPSLPPTPAPRSAAPATPTPAIAPATSYEAPPPPLASPPPPLSVQREHLLPPSTPLMTGEQMTALLRAVVTGTVPTG